MNRCLSLTLLGILLIPFNCPAETAPPTNRVLLVGDSWAQVMWLAKTYTGVFDQEGWADQLEKGDVTALGGSRADQWKRPDRLLLITNEIQSNPSIDTVLILLGGNDFFNKWKATQSQAVQDNVLNGIAADLNVVIQHILNLKTELQVVLCGYTYLNFVETVEAGQVPWCVAEGTGSIWQNMGSPTPLQLNQGLAGLESRKKTLADSSPRITYIPNLGLMQHHFGYPSRNIPPFTLSIETGDPSLPSPPVAMNNGIDCAHLSPEGYTVLAQNCFDQFFENHFLSSPPDLTLSPVLAGTIWSASAGKEVASSTSALILGDTTTNRLYQPVLNFDLSAIPSGASIQRACLFLSRLDQKGMNPFDSQSGYPLGNPVCDLLLSSSPPVLGPDLYNQPPTLANIGLFSGNVRTQGSRLRIEWKTDALDTLTAGNSLTLRLSLSQSNQNDLEDSVFFSHETMKAQDSSPQLMIWYDLIEPTPTPANSILKVD